MSFSKSRRATGDRSYARDSRVSGVTVRKGLLSSTALVAASLASAGAMAQTSPSGGVVVDETGAGGGYQLTNSTALTVNNVTINNTTGSPSVHGINWNSTSFSGTGRGFTLSGTNAISSALGSAINYSGTGGENIGFGLLGDQMITGLSGIVINNDGSIFHGGDGALNLMARMVGQGAGLDWTSNNSCICDISFAGPVSATSFDTGVRLNALNGYIDFSTGTGGVISVVNTGVRADAGGDINLAIGSDINAVSLGIGAETNGAISIEASGGIGVSSGTGIYASSALASGNTIDVSGSIVGRFGIDMATGGFTTTIAEGATVTGVGASNRAITGFANATIINHGSIASAGPDGAAAIVMPNAGAIINTGVISSEGSFGRTIAANQALTLTNSGTISSTNLGIQAGVGSTITNLSGGVISDGFDSAIYLAGTATIDLQEGSTTGSINASASTGAMSLDVAGDFFRYNGGAGVDTVTLAATGAITGASFLNGGNDIFTWEGGSIGALINAGTGTDTFNSDLGAGVAASLSLNTLTGFESYNHQSGDLTLTGDRTGGAGWSLVPGTSLTLDGSLSVTGTAISMNGNGDAATVSILAGSTLNGNVGVYYNTGFPHNFDNAGAITATSMGVFANGPLSATNTGTITATTGSAFSFGCCTSTVTNSGTLTGGTDAETGFGVWAYNGATVNNTGSITGGSGGVSSGRIIGATTFGGPLTVTNGLTGDITGDVGIITGGSSWLTLNNAGLIEGTSTSGVVANGTGTVSITNTADGMITGVASGIAANGGAATIVNDGTITSSGAAVGAAGIVLSADSSITNNASGWISGAIGIRSASGALALTNHGTITAASASGIAFTGGASSIVNSGTITGGDSAALGYGIQGSAASGLSTITNQAGGHISGDAGGVLLNGAGDVILDLQDGSTTGAISSTGAGARTVNLSGLLDGGYAGTGSGANTFNLQTGGAVNGNVAFGSGTNIFNWTGGTISGTISSTNGGFQNINVDLGAGNSGTLSGVDRLFTNLNSGDVTLTGLTNTVVRLQGGNLIIDTDVNAGGSTFGIFQGGSASTATINAGRTVTNAGLLVSSSPGTINNNGTLTSTLGGFVFDLGGVPSPFFNYLVSVNRSAVVANAGVMQSSDLDYSAAIQSSGTLQLNNTGRISGGAAGSTALAYGLRVTSGTATVTNSGAGGILTGADAAINVTGGTLDLTNEGLIAGTTTAIRTAGSSEFTLNNSGTIGIGSVDGAGLYTFSGSGAAIDLANGGTITNSGAITGSSYSIVSYGGELNVTNDGLITGLGGGIYSSDALSLTNWGTVRQTNGGGAAATLADGGTILNYAGGLIEGFDGGLRLLGGFTTVTNAGSITGGANDAIHAAGGVNLFNTGAISSDTFSGVRIAGGGSVANAGAITGGSDADQGYGVQVNGSESALIANLAGGLITGGAGAILLSGDGDTTIDLQAGSTTTGAITATGTGANQVLLRGTFNGDYTGGAGVDNINIYTTADGDFLLDGGAGANDSVNFESSGDSIRSGAITNVETLRFNGTGTVTLTGTNSGVQNFFVNSGAVSVSSNANMGGATGFLGLGGGALQTTASFDTDRTVFTSAFSGQPGRIDIGAGTSFGIAGSLGGDGDLRVTGAGTLNLLTTNTSFSGDIFVDGSALRAGAAGAFGTGAIHLINPTLIYGATGTYANTLLLEVQSPASGDPSTLRTEAGVIATLTGSITQGAGARVDPVQPLVIDGAGRIILTNTANLWAGTTTINAGATLQGATDTISGSSLVANGLLHLVQPTSGTFAQDVSGGGNLQISGLDLGETLTLAGALTNTNGLQVLDGSALAITGSVATTNGSTAVSLNTSNIAGVTSALNNSGSISGVFAINALGDLDLTNSGSISASVTNFNNSGIFAGGTGVIVNTGSITSGTNAIYTQGAGAVTNSGLIEGGGAASTIRLVGAGSSITNLEDGLISTTGTGGGVFLDGINGSVTNAGTITGGNAIRLVQGGAVVNSGTLTGVSGSGLIFQAASSLDNQASGSISGALNGVLYASGLATVTNAGSILGSNGAGLNLLGGGTVTNMATGQITGTDNAGVFAEGGALTLINEGGLVGTGGIAIATSGAFDNVIDLRTGSTTDGSVTTDTGADTLIVAGALTGDVNLGGGDDSFTLLGGGSVTGLIDGATGADSFTSNLGVHSASLSLNALTNFERYTHQTGQLTLTGSRTGGAGWTIAGGELTLAGTLSVTADHGLYASGAATINIADGAVLTGGRNGVQGDPGIGITLNNAGTIASTNVSGGAGVRLNAASTINNSGLIDGGAFHGVSLSGAGHVINNGATGTIRGDRGLETDGAGTSIVNAGLIEGLADIGVLFSGADGMVTNASTGRIAGVNQGLYAANGVAVVNDGLISGGGHGVVVVGTADVTNMATGIMRGVAFNAVYAGGDGSTVTNAGLMEGGDAGVHIGGANGVIDNTGVIRVTGSSAPTVFSGVYISGAGASITNSGTIESTLTGGRGIFLEGGDGAIDNQSGGVISGAGGGAAILLTGANYALNLREGSTINGLIDASAATGLNRVTIAGALNGAYAGGSGADQVTLVAGGVFGGPILGGAGTDSFTLAGAGDGALDVGMIDQFESRTMDGTGTWTLTGSDLQNLTWTINSGVLRASGGSAIHNGASVRVNAAGVLNLADNEAIDSLSGTGSVTLGANTLMVGAAGGSGQFDGVISGSGGLAQVGSGTLALTGENTYTGWTSVLAGTLRLGAGDVLADASSLNVAAGAVMDLQSFNETVDMAVINGALAGSGTLTANRYELNAATINANLGAGALLNLGGVSTLNGISGAQQIAIAGGAFSLGASDRLLDTATVVVAGGAVLDLNAFDDTIGLLGLAGALNGTGTLTADRYELTGATVNANLGAGDLVQISDLSTLNGMSGSQRVSLAGGTLALGASNRLSDTAILVVTDAATLDLGAFDETISLALLNGALDGAGTLSAGQYQLGGATVNANLGEGTLFTIGGVSTLNGTAGAMEISLGDGTLRLGASERLSDLSTVHVAAGARFELSGFDERIGSLAGAGDVDVGAGRLTFGGRDSAFGGRLSGAGSLVHTGGVFTLMGEHTINTISSTGGELRFLGATTGSLSVAGGSLTGAGTIGGALTASSGAVLSPGLAGFQNGVGGFIASGLTLDGASLAIDVLGQSGGNLIDQLLINGVATLTGGSLTPAFQGDVADFDFSTRYLFLQADDLVGRFSNGADFSEASQEGLFWRVRYDLSPNAAVLELRKLTDLDPGSTGTGNQRAIGRALSSGQMEASDDFAGILSQVARLDDADRKVAFDSISGEPLAGMTTSLNGAHGVFLTTVRERALDNRGDGGAGAVNPAGRMSFAGRRESAVDRLSDAISAFDPLASTDQRGGGWISAYAADQVLEGKPGTADVSTRVNGVAGGFGVRHGVMSLGAAAGVTQVEGDVAARQADYQTELWHAAVNAAYDDGSWAAGLALSAYSGDLDTRRGVRLGAFEGRAIGATDAGGQSISASVVRRIQVSDATMVALGAIGTASSDRVDRFTETGAGGLSLEASELNRNWRSIQISARGTQDYRLDGNLVRIYAGAGVLATSGDRRATGDMRFSGAATGFGTFTAEGAETPPLAGLADIGLELGLGEGLALSAGYRGLFSDRLRDDQFGLRLTASW